MRCSERLIVLLVLQAAIGSVAAATEKKVTIPDPENWSALNGAEITGGKLVLRADYAVGSAAPGTLLTATGTEVVQEMEVSVDAALLGSAKHYVRSVAVAIKCNNIVYRGKIRAYREKRTDADAIVQAVMSGPDALTPDVQTLTGIDLDQSLQLKVKITSGKAEFLVDETKRAELNAASIEPGDFQACRIELAGNGPEGIRPSVEGMEATLEVEDSGS